MMQRYKLKEGGEVVDSEGKVVAVDADAGIAQHSFRELENVGVLRWDADAELIFQKCLEFDKTAQGPVGIAKALSLTAAKVRSIMSHPVFIRRLQTEQSKSYAAVGIMRRNSIAHMLDKVIERTIDLLDTAILDQTAVKLLSNLLREARNLRQQERLEHGEANQLVAGWMKFDSSGMESSVRDLLMKHADIAGALATYMLNAQQKGGKLPKTVADGEFRDIAAEAESVADFSDKPAEESVSIIENIMKGIGSPPSASSPVTKAIKMDDLTPSPFSAPGVPSLDMEPIPDVSSGIGV
jgi:hypothetical protein